MSERSELERLAVEAMAKYEQALKDRHHGGVAAGEFVDDMRRILALAAPEESPLKWPGCEGELEVECFDDWFFVRQGKGTVEGDGGEWFHASPNFTTRAAAIAEWNRVVKSLAPTTPEGWREVERCVVITDVDATICNQGLVRCLVRGPNEPDADLLASLNPPPGTPVIRVRRAEV